MFTEEARSNEERILEAIQIRTDKSLFIKGKNLAKMLDLADAKCIHPYIRSLRKKGELVAATSEGYYIASSLQEYTEYIKQSYVNRAYAILVNARDAMKEAYEKHSPIKQLKLDLFIEECIEDIRKKARG